MICGMLSSWISKFVNWINRPVLVTEGIKLSWSDVEIESLPDSEAKAEYKKLPRIFLYTRKNCIVCQEMKCWFDYLWIPYQEVECEQLPQPHMAKMRHLQQYVGMRGKSGKRKSVIFLPGAFPQIDFCRMNKRGQYIWTRHIANSKRLREHVENFIAAYSSVFPGFQSGVYNDLNPEQSAKLQQDAIIAESAQLE